jgi:dTDP-4-dehydrorhamnose 3,5-epimerase
MRVAPTDLPEVLVLETAVHRDARGYFQESFNQRAFDEAVGGHIGFVQDNHSLSVRGVLRGLHFQLPPHAQGKLVRVARGKAFDLVVDVRRSSPRFGRWVGVELSGDNHRQLWVPAGFAHGFLVLSDEADVIYKATDYYAPQCESAIRWDDAALGIAWPSIGIAPLVSAKDAAAPALSDARLFD